MCQILEVETVLVCLFIVFWYSTKLIWSALSNNSAAHNEIDLFLSDKVGNDWLCESEFYTTINKLQNDITCQYKL